MQEDEDTRRRTSEADMRTAVDQTLSRLTSREPTVDRDGHDFLVSLLDAGVLRALGEDADPRRVAEAVSFLESEIVATVRPGPTTLLAPGDDPAPGSVPAIGKQDVVETLNRICPLWPFC